ncbi:protein LURP-one-related 8-like [Magnolia sinica]|uniref:protein LURP-one-related 8-like n=1 Tax=Magnolia sinica TaxID=86752 RepID=UPI00265A47F0|nr:protein LURP-one-related 8-like [Magnolia sinica]
MFIKIERNGGTPHQFPRLMGSDPDHDEIHPRALRSLHEFPQLCSSSPVRLTIWCKSLLFNGNGYTVFDDSNGKMVFRVENYACNRREETFLMDFNGNVLLTIRRCKKKLKILESWEVYRGDQDVLRLDGQQEPLIRATKALGYPSCKIWVDNGGDGLINYWMNWSRHQRWSKIYRTTSGASPVAEVNRKCGSAPETLLGKDVLTLSMQPGMDQAMIMAMIMINDAMR